MNETLKEKVKNSDEPLLIVEDRSIFYIFGGLFSVFLFFFISFILFVMNIWWLKIVSMLFAWIGSDILINLLSFERAIVYEGRVIIERNFLKDIKIKIEDIEVVSPYGGSLILSTIGFYTNNKNFLGFKKSFSIYALSIKDKYSLKELLEKKINKDQK